MANILNIIFSIFGSICVYVIGQLLSKFFIEPVYELRKTFGEVRFILAFHAPTIHTLISRSKERSNAANEALHKSSCDLIANLQAIPYYEKIRCLPIGTLPPRKNVECAAIQLRGLSTYVYQEGDKANASIDIINKRVEKIESLLCLIPLESVKC